MTTEEATVRKMSEITCPRCDKQFELRWDPPGGVPETLRIAACSSAGVYGVTIRCPHCGHEDDVEA